MLSIAVIRQRVYKLNTVILNLKSISVEYRVDTFENLREKYPFYREYGYPYSAMQICKQNEDALDESKEGLS